jgi:hypothetical protein
VQRNGTERGNIVGGTAESGSGSNACRHGRMARSARVWCALIVGVAMSACGGNGSSKPASGTSASTVAGNATTTTTSPDPTRVDYVRALPELDQINFALRRTMTRDDPTRLNKPVLRALCGKTSPNPGAAGGYFVQFDSQPKNQVIVAVAVQGYAPGQLDRAWQQEAAIASGCTSFTQNGYPEVVSAKSTSATEIRLSFRNPSSLVTVSDHLRRLGDFVVSVRVAWDRAVVTNIDENTLMRVVDVIVEKATSGLGLA